MPWWWPSPKDKQDRLLNQPSIWPKLRPDELHLLMRKMLMQYGKDQDTRRRGDVQQLYELWAKRCTREQRHDLLESLPAEISSERAGWWVLMPFLFVEQHPSVIAAAASFVIALYPGEETPLDGARFLSEQLHRLPEGHPVRTGVLGSLLFTGDSRIAVLVRGQWRALTPQQRLRLLSATPPLCSVGLMEFLVEWLEHSEDTQELNAIVKMMGRVGNNAQHPGVIDAYLEWNPDTPGGFDTLIHSVTRNPDYIQQLVPRLLAIARAKPTATELRKLLEAAGVTVPEPSHGNPLSETDVLEQWVVVPTAVLPSWERCAASAIDGDTVLGFVYVDQQAGTTLHVEQVGWYHRGRFSSQGSPSDNKTRTLFRFSNRWLRAVSLLPERQQRTLGLPHPPSWLAIYNKGAPHTLRHLQMLHPFRVPGFPDDVETYLIGPDDEVEQIRVRLHSFQNGTMWGRLLRAPTKNPSLPPGTLVTLGVPSIDVGRPVLISALPKS